MYQSASIRLSAVEQLLTQEESAMSYVVTRPAVETAARLSSARTVCEMCAKVTIGLLLALLALILVIAWLPQVVDPLLLRLGL
jgi:hypothetical protein